MPISTILFPTDFSDRANMALNHAVRLADAFNARLRILHATDEPEFGELDDHEPLRAQIRREAQRLMRDLRSDPALERLDAEIQIVESGRPGPAIVAAAEEGGADLIVMGTHGRRGVPRALMGSVTEEVIRAAPCPVLAVRQRAPRHEAGLFSRVLVPMDFPEEGAARHLPIAMEIARRSDGTLDLLHVVEDIILPGVYGAFANPLPATMYPEVETRVTDEMRRAVLEAPGGDVPFQVHVTNGRPGNAIVDFATAHHSDLIVVASHGRTGFDRFVLGSVSESVVRHAPCPVLVVK
jgi:nucleotide-binding universal stress UspA family protein